MPLISRCFSLVGPGDACGPETLVLTDPRLRNNWYQSPGVRNESRWTHGWSVMVGGLETLVLAGPWMTDV